MHSCTDHWISSITSSATVSQYMIVLAQLTRGPDDQDASINNSCHRSFVGRTRGDSYNYASNIKRIQNHVQTQVKMHAGTQRRDPGRAGQATRILYPLNCPTSAFGSPRDFYTTYSTRRDVTIARFRIYLIKFHF
jgi:hypothetical protein